MSEINSKSADGPIVTSYIAFFGSVILVLLAFVLGIWGFYGYCEISHWWALAVIPALSLYVLGCKFAKKA